VDLKAGLDYLEKRKFFTLTGFEPLYFQKRSTGCGPQVALKTQKYRGGAKLPLAF
jgi:hypothetical protein